VLVSAFVDDFDADRLDPAVWVPHYLPAWSSRAATRASYALGMGVKPFRDQRAPRLAVFDLPDRSVGGDEEAVPELVVDWIRGESE
jgi:hypothetical protein